MINKITLRTILSQKKKSKIYFNLFFINLAFLFLLKVHIIKADSRQTGLQLLERVELGHKLKSLLTVFASVSGADLTVFTSDIMSLLRFRSVSIGRDFTGRGSSCSNIGPKL